KHYSDTGAMVQDTALADPLGTKLNKIVQLIYNQKDFFEITEMLDKWLNTAVQELIMTNRNCFDLFEAYINSVESPCTVDSLSSNLRLLAQLDIDIVSTLLCFLSIVLWVGESEYTKPGSLYECTGTLNVLLCLLFLVHSSP
ncbi:hypothetical protein DFH08DRAFT_712425, partial [Mycena albidolilacea]